MSSEILSLRINSSLRSELQALRESVERSNSYIVEKAIKEYIDHHKWQIKELKLAEKEINEEKFIPGEEVEDYLNSWEPK